MSTTTLLPIIFPGWRTGAGVCVHACIQCALTKTTGVQHKLIRMNPKAIRAEEMFGETNKASGEWVDGVFAAMWSKFNDRNRKDMQVSYSLWDKY